MHIPEYRTILYATDMGESMRPVFAHAVGLARHYRARIVMLHAIEPLGSTGEWVLDAYLPPRLRQEDGEKRILKKMLKKMRKRLRRICEEELGESGTDPVSDIVVVSGRPADAILHQAEKIDADLVVVGSHTDTGLGHGLLGSTARSLTQHSRRPVLVVPVNR